MKRMVHSTLTVKCAALALMLMLSYAFATRAQARLSSSVRLPVSSQGDAEWQKAAFDEEEISVLIPVFPTVIVYTGERLFFQGSDEKILEQRHYSGYSNGFIYAIDSYKVKNPQRLLKDMADNLASHLRFEKDIMRDGFKGKQYRMKNPYYSQVYFFAAARHVYIITLAVSDEANQSPAKFLSSLRLGDSKEVAEANARPAKTYDTGGMLVARAPGTQTSNQGEIFRPSAVTRKATMIWRPEPIYTEEARRNQVSGTVVLRAVFHSSGQVTNIRVMSGLADGLTEKAVEAARSIRFFPAVKDDRLVSQYIQIEYNFNLY
jgi:TonB family protein